MVNLKEKYYCAINPHPIKGCEGLCCHYCQKRDNCKEVCGRFYPKECRERISEYEYFWRKMFGSFDERVEIIEY